MALYQHGLQFEREMYTMNVLLEYSQGCKKHINQDIAGYVDNIYWVIDGATEIFNNYYLSSNGDVHWVVNTLNEELKKCNSSLHLTEILRIAVDNMARRAFDLAPEIQKQDIHTLPTYAICCIKCSEDSVEYLCLGDCSLFISSNPHIQITDNRIEPFHLFVNSVKEKYKDNIILYQSEVKKAVQQVKQSLNKEGGYWIGSFDSSIIEQAITGTIPVSIGDKCIICSDGFRPNIDEANLISYDVNKIFEKSYLTDILQEQKESEKLFFNRTNIDIMDDTTVLLIQI